ncbi:MAG: major royal jelly family protein [Leptolyngbya sp. Prado105]|jgi:sugar lactone lactonase YvrE|nr:major royal jelly family protein [Leptolyngbya sp. Prado105]
MRRNSKFVLTVLLTAALFVAACSTNSAQHSSISPTSTTVTQLSSTAPPRVGQVEIVAELDITPGNVTASRDGRMFASVHGMRRGAAQLIEIKPGKNNWEVFPNKEWNATPGSSANVLNSAHGIAIDSKNRLWVTDHGNWMPNNGKPQQPKLVAFDINTKQEVFRMDFPENIAPRGGIIQDLAVDAEREFVYIADCGSTPAIVTVDINNKTARRFTNHPSLNAENVDLVVEGQTLKFPDANGKMQNARVPINPITLSADGETIYYGAMNGETLYSIPARPFREGATNAQIGQAIQVAGKKPVSDGISTDAEGNHFITNLQDNAIDKLSKNGKLIRLVQDDRFLFPDNVRFGPDSWLYVAVNQLHRSSIFTGKADAGKPPYLIARVWTGTKGQPGR